MDNVSAGEVGGVFAGVVALLYALGRGFGWVFDRVAARIDSRAAEVDAERVRLVEWRASLDRREKESRENEAARHRETEERLDAAEAGQKALGREVMKLMRIAHALRYSLRDVTEELRLHAPESLAAARAEQLLREAFAPDHDLPEDLAELARLIDDDEGEGR